MSSEEPHSQKLEETLEKKPETHQGRNINKCTECGSEHLIRDHQNAEIVCAGCGVVLASKIVDKGPEWRAFDEDQKAKRTRVGAPLTYTIHDKGLSTAIDWHDIDSYGKSLTPGQKSQFHRLRKWQGRIRVSDPAEKSLAYALSDITKISNDMYLPKNVLETASVIYRKAAKERLIRGRPVHHMAAAAVYLGCRQCSLPRTLEDVSQASNVDKKDVGRSYRHIIKNLDYQVPPSIASQHISKFSNQLSMHGKAEEIAYKTLAAAKELGLTSGKSPTGIAAASSYIASVLSGERKTQKDIAEIGQVTEVTVRNIYKNLCENLQFNMSL